MPIVAPVVRQGVRSLAAVTNITPFTTDGASLQSESEFRMKNHAPRSFAHGRVI